MAGVLLRAGTALPAEADLTAAPPAAAPAPSTARPDAATHPTPTVDPVPAPAIPAKPTPSVEELMRQQEQLDRNQAGDGPQANTGFQLALRSGVALPVGEVADSGDSGDISDFLSKQLPLLVEAGGKVNANTLLGAYFGLSFGSSAGRTASACDQARQHCSARGLRFGVEIQYHFHPNRRVNPWVGYAIGYEVQTIHGDSDALSQQVKVEGFEYVHAMLGIDYRLSSVFGLGPLLDLSIGSYDHAYIESNGMRVYNGTIAQKATHGWLMVGLRLVLFP